MATLLVPWRDHCEDGLKGVFEVEAADLPEQKFQGAKVSDLIAVLNEKVSDVTPIKWGIRKVHSILLYGAELRHNRPLEAIVPELTGNSPRLVATMEVRRNTKAILMTTTVRTLTGKTFTICCKPSDTLRSIRYQIEAREGIPRHVQRLILDGRQLCGDNRMLADFGIVDNSVLYLVLRLRGGGGPPRCFADVSDGSILITQNFSSKAPTWRICEVGLNIEGKCESRRCAAFGQMVIQQNKFKPFNLMRDGPIQCPKCKSNVTPITCGFYSCMWKFDGIRSQDGFSTSSRWTEARGKTYHRFDADARVGSVEWDDLLIAVKPLPDASSTQIKSLAGQVHIGQHVCGICRYEFGSAARTPFTTTRCGHKFHRVCTKKWAKQCRLKNMMPRCPECMAEM